VQKYLRERRAGQSSGREAKGPLFLNARGTKLGARGARLILNRWVRKASLERKVSPHTLRHTFCSHLAMKGAPVRAIQELAGHAKISTTDLYMHLAPGATEGAIRLLDQPHPGHWYERGTGTNAR
jgi:integrase/recombinase XerC